MNSAILRLFVLFLFVIPNVSAVHFILGQVQDAYDGTAADGRTIVMWNPANGVNDNLTDVIGTSGNSGSPNTYLFDCELLSGSCNVGDNITVRVFNQGDGYFTTYSSVIVTASGFDVVPELRINSPPNATLNSPLNFANISSSTFDLMCSASDLDSNLASLSLYGNWSGWHLNQSSLISGGSDSNNFSVSLAEGRYQWSCLASDILGVSRFSDQNFTFTVDLTSPVIQNVYSNVTGNVCGTSNFLRVNCSVIDSLSGVQSVFIESLSPNGTGFNTSTSFLSGNTYYADISLDQIGEWSFSCIAYDYSGNADVFQGEQINVRSGLSDLSINEEGVSFSNINPVEGEQVIISAFVENLGCGNAGNFITGFYNGDPDSGGIQIGSNVSHSVLGLSNASLNVSWNAQIGLNNIYVVTDLNNSYSEYNESNNRANSSISIIAWQTIYGNITLDKLIGDSNVRNISLWFNESFLSGNIYIADTESNIDWSSLEPIGTNLTGGNATNDFSDLDILLDMSSLDDSVLNTFTNGGFPLGYADFMVQQRELVNVPVINSTYVGSFITGILWDSSDDSDGQFSQADAEDIVFVSGVSKATQGAYGSYDYEITIPARLRNYYPADSQDVYLYFDLE